ncbi:hypothetical protein [Spirillospora sp. NPDC048819]|uniref:hypothetical protein n=1 Tax=Spirillospora sp. NPDC048819 TaxID=3155268 RepID=UPI0033EABC06
MGFFEERWQRRVEERPPTPEERARADEQAREAERLRLEAELDSIWVSTLSTAERSFEQHDVVQGEPSDDGAWALVSLKQAARAAGYDAVLGVGFCPVIFRMQGDPVLLPTGAVTPGQKKMVQQVFAYGTGVRWLPSAPE